MGSLATVGATHYYPGSRLETVAAPVIETVKQKAEDTLETIKSVYSSKEAPTFFHFSNDWIVFKDNLAPGMKAYFFDGSTENAQELEKLNVRPTTATFYLPERILKKDSSFYVYAFDRNKNRSQEKELYTLDGVVLDTKPPM